MVVKSIHVNPSDSSSEPVNLLEFRLDGTWHTLKMSGSTVFDLRASLADQPVTVVGQSLADLSIILSIAGLGDLDLARQSKFQQTPPYDLVDPGKPLIFQVSFDHPVSFTGIRWNGGSALTAESLPTGMIDWFHYEVSADGTSWTEVPGSDIKVGRDQDAGILEYYWNGYCGRGLEDICGSSQNQEKAP